MLSSQLICKFRQTKHVDRFKLTALLEESRATESSNEMWCLGFHGLELFWILGLAR